MLRTFFPAANQNMMRRKVNWVKTFIIHTSISIN